MLELRMDNYINSPKVMNIISQNSSDNIGELI